MPRPSKLSSSFSLDAVAKQVSEVTVNGLPATFQLDNTKEKLVVTPKLPLLDKLPFRVHIAFTADRALSRTVRTCSSR